MTLLGNALLEKLWKSHKYRVLSFFGGGADGEVIEGYPRRAAAHEVPPVDGSGSCPESTGTRRSAAGSGPECQATQLGSGSWSDACGSGHGPRPGSACASVA